MRQYSTGMIRLGIIAFGALLTLMGLHFVADGRRKVEDNLVFAGAAICLIAALIAVAAIGAMQGIGTKMNTTFNNVSNHLN